MREPLSVPLVVQSFHQSDRLTSCPGLHFMTSILVMISNRKDI